jgi:hypothetical protein
MHLRTVYMVYSECLPTRSNPLAERACFSQALLEDEAFVWTTSNHIQASQPGASLPLSANLH